MTPTHHAFWLQPAVAEHAGCGSCDATAAGPACRTPLVGPTCATPRLDGAAEPLQRAIDALAAVVDPDAGRSIVELQWVQALRIEGGEAELTLTFPLRCGSARLLADGAFQALRHVLPDTDIYVRHAR